MNNKVIRNWIIITVLYIGGTVALLLLNGDWQLLISWRFFVLTLAFLIAMAVQPFMVGTALDGKKSKVADEPASEPATRPDPGPASKPTPDPATADEPASEPVYEPTSTTKAS